jgi:uroporphyrin-3 C-methyltransferase
VADMNTKVSQNDVGSLQKTLADTQQSLQTLQTTVNTQQEALTALHRSGTENNWRVSEAQYLTTLANDNLRLQDNMPLVISLLQNADEKLQNSTDPNLQAIRKALATDIAALQAVPKVDLTGIYMRLLALNGEVDKLPMPNRRADADQGEQITTGGKRVVWWKRGLRQSWEAIKQVVTIRYNKAGQVPFIPPEQQAYLYQNLHAMFEQGLSAVVHKQPEIYRASLQQATEWINQYFLVDAPATQAILTGLTELRAQDLAPKLPEVTASLQAFNEFFAQQATAEKSQTSPVSKQ